MSCPESEEDGIFQDGLSYFIQENNTTPDKNIASEAKTNENISQTNKTDISRSTQDETQSSQIVNKPELSYTTSETKEEITKESEIERTNLEPESVKSVASASERPVLGQETTESKTEDNVVNQSETVPNISKSNYGIFQDGLSHFIQENNSTPDENIASEAKTNENISQTNTTDISRSTQDETQSLQIVNKPELSYTTSETKKEITKESEIERTNLEPDSVKSEASASERPVLGQETTESKTEDNVVNKSETVPNISKSNYGIFEDGLSHFIQENNSTPDENIASDAKLNENISQTNQTNISRSTQDESQSLQIVNKPELSCTTSETKEEIIMESEIERTNLKPKRTELEPDSVKSEASASERPVLGQETTESKTEDNVVIQSETVLNISKSNYAEFLPFANESPSQSEDQQNRSHSQTNKTESQLNENKSEAKDNGSELKESESQQTRTNFEPSGNIYTTNSSDISYSEANGNALEPTGTDNSKPKTIKTNESYNSMNTTTKDKAMVVIPTEANCDSFVNATESNPKIPDPELKDQDYTPINSNIITSSNIGDFASPSTLNIGAAENVDNKPTFVTSDVNSTTNRDTVFDTQESIGSIPKSEPSIETPAEASRQISDSAKPSSAISGNQSSTGTIPKISSSFGITSFSFEIPNSTTSSGSQNSTGAIPKTSSSGIFNSVASKTTNSNNSESKKLPFAIPNSTASSAAIKSINNLTAIAKTGSPVDALSSESLKNTKSNDSTPISFSLGTPSSKTFNSTEMSTIATAKTASTLEESNTEASKTTKSNNTTPISFSFGIPNSTASSETVKSSIAVTGSSVETSNSEASKTTKSNDSTPIRFSFGIPNSTASSTKNKTDGITTTSPFGTSSSEKGKSTNSDDSAPVTSALIKNSITFGTQKSIGAIPKSGFSFGTAGSNAASKGNSSVFDTHKPTSTIPKSGFSFGVSTSDTNKSTGAIPKFGFSFGASNSGTAGITSGSNSTSKGNSSVFGTQKSTSTIPKSGFSFGAPTSGTARSNEASSSSVFDTHKSTGAIPKFGFSFGASSRSNSTSTPSSSLFGTQKSTGAISKTEFSFGAPTSGAPGFNASSTPIGFSIGTSQTEEKDHVFRHITPVNKLSKPIHRSSDGFDFMNSNANQAAGIFGSVIPSNTVDTRGTGIVRYKPTSDIDIELTTFGRHSEKYNILICHICAMKEYETKSIDELRYEDYLAQRKGPSKHYCRFCTPDAFCAFDKRYAMTKSVTTQRREGLSPAINNGAFVANIKTPSSNNNWIGTGLVRYKQTASEDGPICVISAMKEYSSKSVDELRYEDYMAKRKGRSQHKCPFCPVETFCSFDKNYNLTSAGTLPKKYFFGAPCTATTSSTPVFGAMSTKATNTTARPFGASSIAPSTSAPIFGAPSKAPTTSSPIFGAPSTSAPIFGAPSKAPTTSSPIFGASSIAPSTSVPIFGAPSKAPTTSSPIFGAPSTSAPIFGAPSKAPTTSSPIFGASSIAPSTSAPIFGAPSKAPTTSSPTFGASSNAPSTNAPIFGVPSKAPTTSSPIFGASSIAPSTSTPIFGAPITAAIKCGPIFGASRTAITSSSHVFGVPTVNSTSTPIFGGPSTVTTTSTPIFGAASNVTTTSTSIFGAPSTVTTTSTPLFGTASNVTTTGTSIFGEPSTVTTTSTPIFGAASTVTTTSTSTFGGASIVTTTSTPLFGTASNVTTISTSIFGGPSTVTTTSTPIFGAASNVTTTGTSIFGAASTVTTTSTPIFGAASTVITTSTPIFGGPSTVTTTSTSIFGAPRTANTSSTPIFGTSSTTTTSSTPKFGALNTVTTTNSPIFGAPSIATTTGTSIFGTYLPLFGASSTTTTKNTSICGASNTVTTTNSLLFGALNVATTKNIVPSTTTVNIAPSTTTTSSAQSLNVPRTPAAKISICGVPGTATTTVSSIFDQATPSTSQLLTGESISPSSTGSNLATSNTSIFGTSSSFKSIFDTTASDSDKINCGPAPKTTTSSSVNTPFSFRTGNLSTSDKTDGNSSSSPYPYIPSNTSNRQPNFNSGLGNNSTSNRISVSNHGENRIGAASNNSHSTGVASTNNHSTGVASTLNSGIGTPTNSGVGTPSALNSGIVTANSNRFTEITSTGALGAAGTTNTGIGAASTFNSGIRAPGDANNVISTTSNNRIGTANSGRENGKAGTNNSETCAASTSGNRGPSTIGGNKAANTKRRIGVNENSGTGGANINNNGPNNVAESFQLHQTHRKQIPSEQRESVLNVPLNLTSRWQHALKNGISATSKEMLRNEYSIPKHFNLLNGPMLNPEIANSEHFTDLKDEDEELRNDQDQLGNGIFAIMKAIELILTNENIPQAVRALYNSTRLLTDLHYKKTEERIKRVLPLLEENVAQALRETERDETMFGHDMREKVDVDNMFKCRSLDDENNLTSGERSDTHQEELTQMLQHLRNDFSLFKTDLSSKISELSEKFEQCKLENNIKEEDEIDRAGESLRVETDREEECARAEDSVEEKREEDERCVEESLRTERNTEEERLKRDKDLREEEEEVNVERDCPEEHSVAESVSAEESLRE